MRLKVCLNRLHILVPNNRAAHVGHLLSLLWTLLCCTYLMIYICKHVRPFICRCESVFLSSSETHKSTRGVKKQPLPMTVTPDAPVLIQYVCPGSRSPALPRMFLTSYFPRSTTRQSSSASATVNMWPWSTKPVIRVHFSKLRFMHHLKAE